MGQKIIFNEIEELALTVTGLQNTNGSMKSEVNTLQKRFIDLVARRKWIFLRICVQILNSTGNQIHNQVQGQILVRVIDHIQVIKRLLFYL